MIHLEDNTMGLAERRAVKAFQDKDFPWLKKRITEAAGFDVPVEVDWEKITVDGYADSFGENVSKIFFIPVADGLKKIAVDDMGKKALKQGLKKIVITNTADNFGEKAISFEDGSLIIDHDPNSNVEYSDHRTATIIAILEKAL
jgi:hypothetical protein